MKHDSNVVHAFLGKVLDLLKDSWSTLQKCIYFSDGAGSQYMNYKNFAMCQTLNLLLGEIFLIQGVHASWESWKSWKCPGIYFCPGICPGNFPKCPGILF